MTINNVPPNSSSNPYTSTTSTTTTLSHLYQAAFDDVMDILWDHADWTDPLSKSLRQWGSDLFQTRPMTNEDFLTTVLTAIDHLRKNILVNPLDCINHSPLTDPVLERQWTWEKSWLEQWPLMDSTGLSPFDKKPMSAAKPHSFALKMLKWLGGLPPSHAIPNNSNPLIVLLNPANKTLFTPLLNKAAQSYATSRTIKDVLQNVLTISPLATKSPEEIETLCEQECEKLQEDMKAHKKRLEERIEHIKLNYESTHIKLNCKHKLETLTEKNKALQKNAATLETQNK